MWIIFFLIPHSEICIAPTRPVLCLGLFFSSSFSFPPPGLLFSTRPCWLVAIWHMAFPFQTSVRNPFPSCCQHRLSPRTAPRCSQRAHFCSSITHSTCRLPPGFFPAGRLGLAPAGTSPGAGSEMVDRPCGPAQGCSEVTKTHQKHRGRSVPLAPPIPRFT